MTAILGCFPTYKNQISGTTLLASHALANELHAKGIFWGVTAISNPSIDWVRNWFTTFWYYTTPQYTHMLMIDDDMGFGPQVVMDMLAFGEPVVGALYPKKTNERQWAVSGIEKPEVRGPFIEVEGLGAGCLLIRRDAIATMIEKMPSIIDIRPNTLDSAIFKEAGITKFLRPFDCIDDPARGLVSEDISFGRRWRECGGKVWAATHHQMVHVGPHEWTDCYATWSKEEQTRRSDAVKEKLANAKILKDRPELKGKACKHGMFVYNPNGDSMIDRSLDFYGEWLEFEIDTLSSFVKEGDVVIETRAMIGAHTAPLSKFVGKTGKVFSFESDSRFEPVFTANVELNNLGNVYWDSTTVGRLTGYDVNCCKETITIDSFAEELNPTLIKIDESDMAVSVIRGARKTIGACKPMLYINVGDKPDADLDLMLKEIDYVAYWSIGPYFNPMNAFKNPNNAWPELRSLSASLIAVPNDVMNGTKMATFQPYLGSEDTWRKAVERMAQKHSEAAE